VNLEDIMTSLEGHEFAAGVNVASDFRTLQGLIRKDESVRSLSHALTAHDARDRVLRRVQDLARREVDARYENPWDVALTVYVLALHAGNALAGRMAAFAAQRAPRCWWVTRAIAHVLREVEQRGATSNWLLDILPNRPLVKAAPISGVDDLLMDYSATQVVRVEHLLDVPVIVWREADLSVDVLLYGRAAEVKAPPDRSGDYGFEARMPAVA